MHVIIKEVTSGFRVMCFNPVEVMEQVAGLLEDGYLVENIVFERVEG